MGHARHYREDQSELCLLYGVDAVVLRRGRLRQYLRQYLRGGDCMDWFIDVDPLGPKYVSQGAVLSFR